MKIVLFADNKVGMQVFEYFIKNYPEDLIKVVVTSTSSPIYTEAKLGNVSVEVFNDFENNFSTSESNYDLGILAWWPNIIKETTLGVPKFGFINFHPSLLPFNRGKHYNFWALVEQSPFGVSIHKVDSGVDTGDIVSQKTIDYGWEDSGETLYNKAQVAMVDLFKSTYPILRDKDFNTTPQDLANGSFHYSSELEKASQINLDQSYTARELLNLLRARTFKGHPSCWFEDENSKKYEIRIDIKRKN